MAYLEVFYYKQGEGLQISAKVGAAWCWHKNCYCFSESEYLEYRADWRIRVQLQVIGTPYYLGKAVKKFPEGLAVEGDSGCFHFVLANENVRVLVPNLLDHLQWLKGAKKAGIFSTATIRTGERVDFDIKLWAVFHPPPMLRPTTVWEWDTIGPSAGLPSLGKRR